MKKIILAALLALSCGTTYPPTHRDCQLATECESNNGLCFSCNAGYVCGDDGKGDVTCVEKDVFGGRTWHVTANNCPNGEQFQYTGVQYNMCYNTRRQAVLTGCTHIEDNCH